MLRATFYLSLWPLFCISGAFAADTFFDDLVRSVLSGSTELNIQAIDQGASNMNYHVIQADTHYFVRQAPPTTKVLYADQQVEYDVLWALEPLHISPKPLYFDKNRSIIVTEFIYHHDETIDLLDPVVQSDVCGMLRSIEDSHVKISRTFSPYADTMKMLSHAEKICTQCLPQEFYEILLPSLEKISNILTEHPRKALCHLDLHHKNILKNENHLVLIDWEYSSMSHPYLTLASMAAIERWSDEQMYSILSTYTNNQAPEDKNIIYLYRIVADIFWTVWNHVQDSQSTTSSPYREWRDLFYRSALERIGSSQWQKAVEDLHQSIKKEP